MAERRAESEREIFDAHRLAGIARTAHIIGTLLASAGKSYENPPSAKEIFDQLTGTHEIPLVDENDDDSLAQARAERRAREAAQGGNTAQH